MEQKELLKLSRTFVRRAVNETGLGNVAFCNLVGIKNLGTLKHWLYGSAVPMLETLFRIEQKSGVCPDDCGLMLHAALDCADEMRNAARRGVAIKHIAIRCNVSPSTINAMIERRSLSAISLLTAYENWVANDCANWFASEYYVASLVKQKEQKKPTQDEAVAHWVYNSFGPEIVKSLTRPQDGLWAFETGSKYKCLIEHMDGFRYRFRAIWKPKDRLSVERVIVIAAA